MENRVSSAESIATPTTQMREMPLALLTNSSTNSSLRRLLAFSQQARHPQITEKKGYHRDRVRVHPQIGHKEHKDAYWCRLLKRLPQLGTGSSTPRPRKERVISASTYWGMRMAVVCQHDLIGFAAECDAERGKSPKLSTSVSSSKICPLRIFTLAEEDSKAIQPAWSSRNRTHRECQEFHLQPRS